MEVEEEEEKKKKEEEEELKKMKMKNFPHICYNADTIYLLDLELRHSFSNFGDLFDIQFLLIFESSFTYEKQLIKLE